MADKRYNIIYADPPWSYSNGLRSSKKNENGKYLYYKPDTTVGKKYITQSGEWIKNLDIQSIVDDNAILFMWTTDSHLKTAIEVIEAWGFAYKTIAFVWNKKEKSGKQVCYMGNWTMKGSEICLLATKGKIHNKIKSHKVRQLVEAERMGHSQKPYEIRNRIVELMGDLPRIELFAREKTEKWDVWGNEVQSDIKLESKENIIIKPKNKRIFNNVLNLEDKK